MIVEHFDKNGIDNKDLKFLVPKKSIGGFYSSPEMLSIYDEYVENQHRPDRERLTVKEFVVYVNSKYNLNFTNKSLTAAIERLQKSGLRPKLTYVRRNSSYEQITKSKTLEKLPYVQEANELRATMKRSDTYESKSQVCKIVEEKHNLKPRSLYIYMNKKRFWD